MKVNNEVSELGCHDWRTTLRPLQWHHSGSDDVHWKNNKQNDAFELFTCGLKSKKAVGNDRIPSEVYKFASGRLLTFMSIFLSGCMLPGKLPSTLMHVVIIPLLKCKSKDPADVNNYRPIAIATALSKVLEQVLLSWLARYLWTTDSQFGFKRAHGTEMAIFALKQTVDFYRIRTPVYMCFLDAKKAFDRVNHWMLVKKLLDRNVPLHIVKLFIFWYREQEFMVRSG